MSRSEPPIRARRAAMYRFIIYGAGLGVLGVLVIVGSLYLETIVVADATGEKPLYLKVFDHIGIAFLSLGIVGIILDLPNWQKYFQERLGEVVTQRNYLNTLGNEELIALQTATLKAFFKVEDIDREGSLLNFFHSRIHKLIASPFRENIASILQIERDTDPTYLSR